MDANRALDTKEEERAEVSGDRVSFAEIAMTAVVGAAAGATAGGAVGAAAAAVIHEDGAHQDAEDARRDRDIGVIGGNIGEAPPDAPKAERGVFHAASLGIGEAASVTPADGPMQSLDEA